MIENAQQMVTYFSGFLQQINHIILNIKQSIFELVNLSMPTKKVNIVYESMPSLILSTHKIFDDLKKVQSILHGVIKSKRIIRSIHQSKRSLSQIKYSYLSPHQGNIYQNHERISKMMEQEFTQQKDESKTMKKQVLSSTHRISKVFSHENSQSPTFRQGKNSKFLKNKSKKSQQVENVGQKGVQSRQKRHIQDHLRSIIKMNRSSLSNILDNNKDCLRLVKSVRKQLKAK